MQTEKDKIISLLQSENPDNVALGHELEESLGIDLSDFWIDLEEIHRLVTEETYQRPYKSIFSTIPDCDELLKFTRSVTTLKLSNRNLTALPSAVKYLYNLTTLELNNNAFTEIPTIIFKFSQLRLLALNNNKIKELPSDILGLLQLSNLELNNNEIERLPENIGDFYHLSVLFLRNNQLENLPKSLAELTSLEQLDIRGNSLSNICPDPKNRLLSIQEMQTYPHLDLFASLLNLPKLIYFRWTDNAIANVGEWLQGTYKTPQAVWKIWDVIAHDFMNYLRKSPQKKLSKQQWDDWSKNLKYYAKPRYSNAKELDGYRILRGKRLGNFIQQICLSQKLNTVYAQKLHFSNCLKKITGMIY